MPLLKRWAVAGTGSSRRLRHAESTAPSAAPRRRGGNAPEDFLMHAPILGAVPAGCTCGAAARRRSLKAAGAAPPHAPRSGCRQPFAGSGRARERIRFRAGAASPSRSARSPRCWNRAGSAPGSCARLWTRSSTSGRPAGSVAGAPAGGQRTAGDPGAEPAVELSGAASRVPRRGSARPAGAAPVCRCVWSAAFARGGREAALPRIRRTARPGAGAGH